MSNWSLVDGVHRSSSLASYARPSIIGGGSTSSSSSGVTLSASHNHAADQSVSVGDFVETTNLSSATPYSNGGQPSSARPYLIKAQTRSPCVLGVCDQKNSSGVSVVHAGVSFAWVVLGDHKPPLSGIYKKTINGVLEADVVIDVLADNSFVMSQTHDSDLQTLTKRFDALTVSPG